MREAQLAINTISTSQQDLPEALAAYAGAGFRQVEFYLPLVKEWLAQGNTVGDVSSLLTSHGLQSIGGFELAVECFSTPQARAANHDLHLGNSQLIHELGGGTLVVGTDGPAQLSIDALDAVAESLGELAGKMHGLNVDIALEFNWSPIVKSLKSAVAVVEKVGDPKVGVLFDPAHYYTTVTKLEHLDAEGVRWIKHVHLDDMRDKPGELSNCNSDRVLPGAGILPLNELIARLEAHGYRGHYSIEMFSDELWALPADEAARRCYESLLPLCSA
jgi:4-hydroxyphenylpyruvate dioxygenase